MTGLAAIGSSATLGFWDGGGSKHKPGFGVSKVLAYIGITALALAIGGATGAIGKGTQLAAGAWNRLFGAVLRVEKSSFTWKGLGRKSGWAKVDLWHAHLFGGSRHLPWETQIVTAVYLYVRRLLHNGGGIPLVPPVFDHSGTPAVAPLTQASQ